MVAPLSAVVNLDSAWIYPNPFSPGKWPQVTTSGVPVGTTANIYTLNGELIWEGKSGTSGLV